MRDERRENERYQHESLAGQALGELRTLWRNPKVLLVLGIILVGWVVLVVIQPDVVQLERLQAGDCIYVPMPDHGLVAGQRPIGTAAQVADGLVRAGAERAPCELSHGHEVAAAFLLDDSASALYPGAATLESRQLPACEAAFTAYVGRPSRGSTLELTVVVPDAAAWDEGRRAGACLVSNADGTYLSGRARGSGR